MIGKIVSMRALMTMLECNGEKLIFGNVSEVSNIIQNDAIEDSNGDSSRRIASLKIGLKLIDRFLRSGEEGGDTALSSDNVIRSFV